MSAQKFKPTKYVVRKYNGDDCYSYAVFQEGASRPIRSGESRMDANAYRDHMNRKAVQDANELNAKHNK
jgi:hypothetical protein